MSYPAGPIRHRKLPADAVIHTREPVPPEAADIEAMPQQFIAAGMAKLAKAQDDLARRIENRSYVVDEYQPETLTADSEMQIVVFPTYEYMPEKIEAIIIGGPPNANVTLQLGDRILPLVIPATGILPIGYVAILLGRNDPRVLTAQTAGDYFLELMGVADQRFSSLP
jgi:hypothetical protein